MSTHDEVYKLGSLKLVIIASNKIGNYNDILQKLMNYFFLDISA